MSSLQARVRTLRWEADGVVGIELVPLAGAHFPAFDAGSHVDLHLGNGMVRSYSLCNDPAERDRYVLGVLNDRASRGGSRWVHEQLRVGAVIDIGAPRNNFVLDETAAHSVLLAGGIGITPILCMARRLKALGRSYEVICLARSRAQAAFREDLQALGADVTWHFDDERGGPPDLHALLAARPAGHATHYYACGPAPMLDAFERQCAALGYANVHIERFAAVEVAAAADARTTYLLELRQSGKRIEVTSGMSLLQAVRAAGVSPLTSCEDGICGACETRVLEGLPDHRDSVLSPAEHETGHTMMICVGGCRSERLVLDL
ncbi:oxidoreductase [Ramlibacter sp. AW1]|uniref:Oxidoreductase n=1 Tax=Ramlibacter aurantiacus TaxID=2801330 RepID=A0A936ZNP0_9BURK|nr:PDR/VanB family oxidoreductase [Ramlibacter aurantiacus]MBL0420648.1 oxidoreductase [Ramlibacter aurantiacus]